MLLADASCCQIFGRRQQGQFDVQMFLQVLGKEAPHVRTALEFHRRKPEHKIHGSGQQVQFHVQMFLQVLGKETSHVRTV
jgi:predicted ester cyclase